MAEDNIEMKAMKFAEEYYEKLGWEVVNVSRMRGGHSGYDLYLRKGEESLKVEVKGCSRLYHIPDLYGTEIDRDTMQLIADELCVVYYTGDEIIPKLARVPREALTRDHITPKLGYRISGRFKNERTMKPFLVDV